MCWVYIDDGSGGIILQDNLFHKTGSPGRGWVYAAVYIHGGHDNIAIHNIFSGLPGCYWSGTGPTKDGKLVLTIMHK